MPRSPEEMMDAILANVTAKTGQPVAYWLDLIRSRPDLGHRAAVEWLKSEHGVGHSTASVLFQRATHDPDALQPGDAELVDRQYAGARAGLRPIYERVVAAALGLSDDVVLETRQVYVGLTRKRQFAVLAASTRDRVDLGLRLDGVAPGGRLLESRSLGSGSINRKVELRSLEDVDAQVLAWLRDAWAASA